MVPPGHQSFRRPLVTKPWVQTPAPRFIEGGSLRGVAFLLGGKRTVLGLFVARRTGRLGGRRQHRQAQDDHSASIGRSATVEPPFPRQPVTFPTPQRMRKEVCP